MATSTAQPGQPWARASGLLGGCVATLGGVLNSIDPDVILFRATIAAIVTGLMVRLLCLLCHSFQPQQTLDDDE